MKPGCGSRRSAARNGSTTSAARFSAPWLHLEQAPLDDLANVGAIALACALGYLDLRFEGAWRADHPRLVAWLEKFAAATPAFEATRFVA